MNRVQKTIRLSLCCALSFSGMITHAQVKYPVYWAPKPVLHSIPDSLKKESAVYVLEERQVEFVAGKSEYELYKTYHHIIRLQDEKGVEAFNTFNIPIGNDRKLTEVKARTILPDGKVIEVTRDKVKEVKNEDGNPEFRVAMEGVERGAEVELLYTEQRPFSTSGWEVFQFGVPAMKGTFHMIVPEHLKFESKGYNGFPEMTDSLSDKQHFYQATSYGIRAIEEENYSRYRPSLQRIDYKLSYVAGESATVRRNTWAELAKELYKSYCTYTDKEEKIVRKMVEKIGVNPQDDEQKKIMMIEDYLKTNITMSTSLSGDEVSDFDYIVDKKLTTERGFVRFFEACLKQAGVNNEMGLAAGRFSYQMDDVIEMWDHLDVYMLYFPKLQTYLAPSAVNFRYPYIPYFMCGGKGVFCKTTSFGNVTSALPDVRTIPFVSMDNNSNTITAEVSFKQPDMIPDITITNAFKGYNSGGLREIFLYGTKDKEKDRIMEITGLADKTSDIQRYEIADAALTNFSSGKPLRLTVVVQSPKLMEKAGPKFLFKVGDVIGRQSEMYHDDHRTLPIEMEYPHSLPRTIRINIPEGYAISNPEAVRINVMFNEEGRDVCGFKSDYTIQGNVMTISILEFYEKTSFPVSSYESFRKVINAAADFNKVTLVLQKV